MDYCHIAVKINDELMTNMNKPEKHNIELEKAIFRRIYTVQSHLYQVQKFNVMNFMGMQIGKI